MRASTYRFLGRATPTTISAGAVALLMLSLAMRPVDSLAATEKDRIEHLEALLVQHDVRYAMQVAPTASVRCEDRNTEHGR